MLQVIAFFEKEILGVLLYLYQNLAFQNLGLAVIELTILLRILLLPFSIFEERSRSRYEKVSKKIDALNRDFKNDQVKLHEEIRMVLSEAKVSYWSKVVLIATQLFVLVFLYQVFLSGINFSMNLDLPSWVPKIQSVNTMFLGFDVGKKSLFWPGLVAIILFLEIFIEQRSRKNLLVKGDVLYLIGFPLFSFVVLLLLPMVKSLFILTSMFFTMFLFWFRKLFFSSKNH